MTFGLSVYGARENTSVGWAVLDTVYSPSCRYLGGISMDVWIPIITGLISGAVSIIACLINNNLQRQKEQFAIEQKIDSINANYDKSTALIEQKIETLTQHVNQHNNLVERMYRVEALTAHLDDMLTEIRGDDRR